MSEMSALLGVGVLAFEFEGVEYAVKERDLEIEALLEAHLENESLRVIQRFEGQMSAEQVKVQNDGWRRDVASSVYCFGSPAFIEFYSKPAGARVALFHQLAKHNPRSGIKLATVDRIWKDRAKWAELVEKVSLANDPPLAGGGAETTPAP